MECFASKLDRKASIALLAPPDHLDGWSSQLLFGDWSLHLCFWLEGTLCCSCFDAVGKNRILSRPSVTLSRVHLHPSSLKALHCCGWPSWLSATWIDSLEMPQVLQIVSKCSSETNLSHLLPSKEVQDILLEVSPFSFTFCVISILKFSEICSLMYSAKAFCLLKCTARNANFWTNVSPIILSLPCSTQKPECIGLMDVMQLQPSLHTLPISTPLQVSKSKSLLLSQLHQGQ